MMKHYCFALLAFAAALSTAWAQPGALDPAFATKGLKKFSFHHNLSADQALASVQDASGNLYVAGFETTTSGTQNPFVVKMLPSGKLDPTFGTEGKTVFLVGNTTDGEYFYPNAITLQNNGKIVLAGYFYYTGDGSYPYASVLRLNADGSLDVDFGPNGGYYYYNTQSTYSTVVIANNTIFASGGTYTPSDQYADFIISAIDTTGSPVYIDGYPAMDINFSAAQVADYATCSVLDGDILYVGGTTQDANGYTVFGYSAFNTKTLDTVAGRATIQLPISTSQSPNTCTTIKVTANHELFLGGYVDYYDSNNQRDFLLYKLNASGQTDATFSIEGYQTYKLGTNLYNAITTMLLDGSNIILAGNSNVSYSDTPMWGAIRVNTSSGLIDASFSSANISTIEGSDECITSVIKSSDGNYYFTGTTNTTVSGTSNEDVLVKKVTLNGANVTGFGSGSQSTIWIEDYDGIVTDLAQRPDGKFWISGYYKDPADNSKFGALALLNSNGSTDTTTVKGNGDATNGDVGIINIAKLMQAYPGFQNAVATAIEVESTGTLLVAGTYTNANFNTGAFLIRVGADGTLQSFNGTSFYNSFNMDGCYPHEIVIQPNNYILVSGYATQMLAVARFTSSGATDPSFGTAGVFVFTDQANEDVELNYVQMKLQSDGKILCSGAYFGNDPSGDFLVFRLTSAGILDSSTPGFGTGGFFTYAFNPGGSDFASALAIKSNGQILAGGQTQIEDSGIYKYALLQLNSNGTLDNTFGNATTPDGTFQYLAEYDQHSISTLEIESANAIVATGNAGSSKGDFYMTALRITAAGKLDLTFNGQGHATIGLGYTRTSRLYNGQLYIIGGTSKPVSLPVKGQIARLNLGTGPVIKTNNLKLPDHLNVTYGDAPFTLKPITNSYGPITYTVTYGAYQGTVDSKTGLVTIKEVPGDDYPLQIQAYQAAVPGYTEAYATVKIYIAPALPTIVFTDQGGLVGETIRLSFQTNSDTTAGYSYSFSSPNFQSISRDSVMIVAEGSTVITLNLNSTTNYDYASATATIHGYIQPIPPVAADDNVDLIQGLDQEVAIPVLANDQAYTGRIVPTLIDLDPSTSAIDSVYFSSALGAFRRDKAGIVHYIPFQGLVGKGEISYTITDSRGDVSAPAKISVSVQLLGQKPSLKATELVTPNNDGLNDAFVIGYVDFEKENTLKIYDRNGQELLTLNNYRNDWEGTLPNGKQVENGIYYYLFREGGDERELKGVVEFKK